jgi:glyoxylate reductase
VSAAMSKPRVYITRRIPEQGLDLIRDICDVEVWQEELPPSREVILREARDCDGLVCLLTDTIDSEALNACPRLRVVSNLAVGFDNIDVQAATALGVLVGNTPDVLTETTADFAFALLMAAARRVVEGVDYARAGQWRTWGPMLLLGADVHHATLGIIGLGRIGEEMAKRARGFDMRVLYYAPHRQEDVERELGLIYTPLDELIAQADFVSLHTPLTPETRHLMNRARFARMKPSAVLINTARGAVVETDALVEALRSGQIAYAALDVTDPEPLPADHPLVTLPNCIVTPHIASASRATRGKMSEIAARNLLAGLNGQPLPYGLNNEVLGTGRNALPRAW